MASTWYVDPSSNPRVCYAQLKRICWILKSTKEINAAVVVQRSDGHLCPLQTCCVSAAPVLVGRFVKVKNKVFFKT